MFAADDNVKVEATRGICPKMVAAPGTKLAAGGAPYGRGNRRHKHLRTHALTEMIMLGRTLKKCSPNVLT